LLAGFAQEPPLHGVERLLAPLRGLERLPCGVVHGHVEQREERRQHRLQGTIEGKAFADDLLANLAEVVPVLDLEVALEEVDHRPVARRLAVRDRGALESEPALEAMRVDELVEEARLAHASLAHDGRHLPPTLGGELLRATELVQLSVPADERR